MMRKMLLILLIGVTFVGCDFAPGSYPYAEIYEFQINEEILIDVVKNFKEDNSEYCLPKDSRLTDGWRNENDHWYHLWFYYPKDHIIVKGWIRGNEIALVGIGNYPDLDGYKELNKDFSKEENILQKEKFENLILNKIIEISVDY